jgi:exopolyphosphatase/guanosine-5'-triphosphate,3'-diphosphate pyrophosphatase
VKPGPFAAIDIGTNTLRLLIAEIQFDAQINNYTIREKYSERIITRLGQGIAQNGLIPEQAIKRNISVLKQFSDIIAQHRVRKTAVVATHALRDAGNSYEFLRKSKEMTGLEIEVISGEDEAKKTATGMLIGISIPETALMVDIGGGSTELIFAKQGKPEIIHSMNLGVVYLADKFMKNDPPMQRDLDYMAEKISMNITAKARHIITSFSNDTIFIGTAGTVTSLAALSQKLTRFEHNKIHNTKISRDTIQKIFSHIALITAKERARHIPFEPTRLDIIVPGILILLKLMEAFSFQEVLVSNYGLREGVLVELYEKDNLKT